MIDKRAVLLLGMHRFQAYGPVGDTPGIIHSVIIKTPLGEIEIPEIQFTADQQEAAIETYFARVAEVMKQALGDES